MGLLIPLVRRSAAQVRYAIAGSLVIVCALQLIIVGQAVSIEEAQSFSSVANLMPSFISRGLGSKALLLASFKGTVILGYFHPLVCVLVPVMAMYATTEPARDIEAGLVDLMLARSIRRSALLTRSLIFAAIWVAAAAISMALGTWLGVKLFDAARLDLPSARLIARLLAHLVGVAACFGGFALFVGAFSSRRSAALTTGVMAVVVMYLVDFLSLGWRVISAIDWLSPFYYYHGLAIASGDAPEARDLIVLFGSGLVFTAIAYWKFERRDL
jgi:ABC-type transport system involved in multi-copper enzyme maturation permease subunit